MSSLSFPPLVSEAPWAATEPMSLAAEDADPGAADVECPWGPEVAGQPVQLVFIGGVAQDGHLLSWESAAGRLRVQAPPDYAIQSFGFGRLRQVALARALPGDANAGAPRALRIEFSDGARLDLRIVHRVDRPEAHYLIGQRRGETAMRRWCLPRTAVRALHMAADAGRPAAAAAGAGRSGHPARPLADDGDRFEPVRDRAGLERALAAGSRWPALPLGEVLRRCGLVDPVRLDALLAAPDPGGRPLGERLVRAGLLTSHDLRRALQWKLGLPLVDLKAWTPEPALLDAWPLAEARALQALPLVRLDQGLVVVQGQPGDPAAARALALRLGVARLLPVLPWQGALEVAIDTAYALRDVAGRHGGAWHG